MEEPRRSRPKAKDPARPDPAQGRYVDLRCWKCHALLGRFPTRRDALTAAIKCRTCNARTFAGRRARDEDGFMFETNHRDPKKSS